jgi:hypothetical protein
MLHCPDCNGPLENAFQPCPKCDREAAAALASKIDTSAREADAPPQPQPSPLFASYGEPDMRKARSRKKFLIVAAVLVLVLLAREGGMVNWYLLNFTANTKISFVLYGHLSIQSADKIIYNEVRKFSEFTATTRGHQYGFDFRLLPSVEDLQEEIENGLKKEPGVTASVELVELTGAYWLPFSKTGNCIYRVRLQFLGKDSINYSGVLDGETYFELSGVSSVRSLKQAIGAEIAKKVVESLNSFRK